MKNIFFISLSLLLVAGFIIIFFIMNINYKPIEQLSLLAKSISPNNLLNTKDELEAVEQAILEISNDNKKLTIIANENLSATRELELLNLIKGIHNYESSNQPPIIGSFAITLLLFSSHKLDLDLIKSALVELENNILSENDYLLHTLEGNQLVLAIAEEDKYYKEKIEKIHFLFSETMRINTTVGVGSIQPPENLWRSYAEASAALEYSFVRGRDLIIYSHDIAPDNANINVYPKHDIETLDLSLASGNIENSIQIIKRIADYIKQKNLPIFFVRCIYFEIISMILKKVFSISKSEDFSYLDNFSIHSLMKVETLEQLSNIVENFCILYKNILVKQETQEETLLSKIIAYIEENYTHSTFSIKTTASHFNMSQSNLGQYFKTHKGENISDYIYYLQIERAKELLVNTRLPLNEIILQIGHCDVSSFIRKFKSHVGVTPGEYRKLNNQK